MAGVLRSPKEPAGMSKEDAALAAKNAADLAALNAALSGATKVEKIKLPEINKVKKEYGKEMAAATEGFTKGLKAKLEGNDGVPTNSNIVDVAKLTGFWKDEKIEDIDGFVKKVKQLLMESTLEAAKNLPALYTSIETGRPSTNISLPETVDKTGVPPGAVMSLLNAFGEYYNRTAPGAKIGFGKPDGKTMTALNTATRDGEEFETAGVFLIWRGSIKLAADNLGTL
jgi:hypothetical protein